MLSQTYEFEIVDAVVQLVSVFVVDAHSTRYLSIDRFPDVATQKYPPTRLCNFDKRPLLISALVANTNNNCPDCVSLILSVTKIVFHKQIIYPN